MRGEPMKALKKKEEWSRKNEGVWKRRTFGG